MTSAPGPAPALQHASLETRRDGAEAEAAFFELLGFMRVAPPPSLSEDRAWWLQGSGGTQIHLLFDDAPVAPPSGHVALDLGDAYDAVLAALRAAGHDVEPRTPHWGGPRAYVRSPGGHRVELMAAAPPA
jgi:catechol 2,3-dioxygenase-like lactoylglutathione lyase family enzyme